MKKDDYYFASFWLGFIFMIIPVLSNGNIALSILGVSLFFYGFLSFKMYKSEKEDTMYKVRYILKDEIICNAVFSKEVLENNLAPSIGDTIKLDNSANFFQIKKRVFFQDQDAFLLCFEVEKIINYNPQQNNSKDWGVNKNESSQ